MYSVVLMAALTAGSSSSGHWFRNPCHGCSGCYGCYGCHGWGYSTYAGNFCHGCYGVCSGCYGAYTSWSYGHYSTFSVYAPAVTCWGTFGCTGCYGCYGGWSCYGAALPHHGYWHEYPPGEIVPQRKGTEKIEETPPPKEQKKEKKTEEEARAQVTIDVPADAKVYVDGQLMKSTSAKRAFRTPVLVPGQTYFYDVRVEIVRDGRTIVENQRVILNPGQAVTASFPNLNQGAVATAQSD
jgi:uncharacterized protein (TIGR03000 family)